MKPLPLHYIANLSYSADVLECSCGASMKAKPDIVGLTEWQEHRRANGQSLHSIGQKTRRTAKGTFNPSLASRKAVVTG